MTAITYENLYSAPSQNIFDIVDTRANVSDPRDPVGVKTRKFVYNSEPRVKATDFSLYPYILVEDAMLDFPETRRTDAEREFMSWTQPILVRANRDGAGNSRSDIGLTEMRNIVNAILQTFKSTTIRNTLRGYNMYDLVVRVVGVDSVSIDQADIHETALEVSYSTDIKVIA